MRTPAGRNIALRFHRRNLPRLYILPDIRPQRKKQGRPHLLRLYRCCDGRTIRKTLPVRFRLAFQWHPVAQRTYRKANFRKSGLRVCPRCPET